MGLILYWCIDVYDELVSIMSIDVIDLYDLYDFCMVGYVGGLSSCIGYLPLCVLIKGGVG